MNRNVAVGVAFVVAIVIAVAAGWWLRGSTPPAPAPEDGEQRTTPKAAKAPGANVAAPVGAIPAAPARREAATTDGPDAMKSDSVESPKVAALPDAGQGAKLPQDAGSPDAAGPLDSASGGAVKTPPTGQLSKETIREGISTMKPAVKRCYEELLREFPEADGRITMKFAIVGHEGEGRIDLEKIDEDKSSLFDRKLNQCVLDGLREVSFPAPADGAVNVTYPFKFSNAASPEAGP